MNTAISYLQHLFIPSYLTILYAFLSGAAYGVTGHKYGFIKVTIGLIVCSGAYVAYTLGIIK
jgi:hypothetical protein